MFKQSNINPILRFTWELLADPRIGQKMRTKLRADARSYQYRDYMIGKLELKQMIDSSKDNRKLAVYHWGRDCDQCEADGVTAIPATVVAYENWEARIHDNAEGPTRTEIISFDEYRSFASTRRDHRAEQYNY